MSTFIIETDYGITHSAYVNLPNGKSFDDIHEWSIKWDTFSCSFKDGNTFEIELEACMCDPDFKHPENVRFFNHGKAGELQAALASAITYLPYSVSGELMTLEASDKEWVVLEGLESVNGLQLHAFFETNQVFGVSDDEANEIEDFNEFMELLASCHTFAIVNDFYKTEVKQ